MALALFIATPTVLLARPMPQQTQQGQKQKPTLPPARYIPKRDYDTRDITLNLRFDWEKEQAIGTAAITFAPLMANLRAVSFDAANMTINSVKLASGAMLKFEADMPKEQLRINLDRAYQPSDVLTVIVDYHTNGVDKTSGLAGFGRGLTFIKPTPDDPTRPRQIWSQGESEYNHYWFPCFDHPNDFATSELYATVEKPLTVISNGKLLDTKNNSDNTRTFHWKIEQPHASYLTSIVVGEYTPIEQNYAGIPVISYVYPNEVEEGKVTVARMADMVKFFSEKTGVKYPYAKYSQTMTRDFGGGMENISATTQTDNMIHDARTELDQTSDSLQSHELAHQWFGDYVTCRNWSDIWLNESFATYFQAMWDEHSLGNDDFLYRDVKGNQDAYYQAWARGQRRPIVTKNYADPDAVFDTYAYPRGGAVLHMLRKTLGEDNWWRSINHYLTKNAHQPVQTEQLRIAIEETTGQPMDWFFDEWVYKMAHPIFNVTQNYDATAKTLTVNVKQEQELDPDAVYPQAELFTMPVDIEIGTTGNTRIERVMIEPKKDQSFTFTVDAQPRLVNFDYGDTLIKELKFEKSTDDLVFQLANDADMMGRLWALTQLAPRVSDKATADADVQKIVAAIGAATTGDKFWGVRTEAAGALKGVAGDAARTALLAATKDRDAHVRARAVQSLGASKDATLANVYIPLLGDQSYATVRAAATALGQTKNTAGYDALAKLVETPSWRDSIRASGLIGLAALGDARGLEMALRYAPLKSQTAVRAAAITLVANVGKNDPRTFPLVSAALIDAAAGNNFQLGAAAAEGLVTLGDPRGVGVFDEAIKKNNNPQAKFFLMGFQKRLQAAGQTATPKP
jgi:aminopeptidase N